MNLSHDQESDAKDLQPCPNCGKDYDVDNAYCPNCGFAGKWDVGSGFLIFLAALIPGAMATCSVTLIANTYGITSGEWRTSNRLGDSIGLGFSMLVLPVALLILIAILHHMLGKQYRERIDLRSLMPFLTIIGLFALGWAGFLIRQIFGTEGSGVITFCVLWAALSLLVCFQIGYFVNKELKRRKQK